MNASPLLTILSGTTNWGNIAIGGALGYASELAADRVVTAPGEHFDELLSAHAMSDVTVELHEPAQVQGFISGSSPGDCFNPVLFTIDHNSLGLAWQTFDASEAVVLAPGVHRLRCLSRNGYEGLHSVWGFRRVSSVPARALEIFTVGRYPLDKVDWKLMNFTRSVTRFGRLAHVLGAGKPMESWPECKVADTLKAIRGLPDSVTHILFSDGEDAAILGDETALIERFRGLGTEFLISAESNCWPVRDDPEWEDCFPPVQGNKRFINSGGWMATREGAETVLAEVMRTYYEVRGSRLPAAMEKWGKYSRYVERSDQWNFQMALLAGRVRFHVDHGFELFSSMGTECRLLENNPEIDLVDGKLHSIFGNTYPLLLHFNSHSPGLNRWLAMLGVLRGPARPGCSPAGAEADPYRTDGIRGHRQIMRPGKSSLP